MKRFRDLLTCFVRAHPTETQFPGVASTRHVSVRRRHLNVSALRRARNLYRSLKDAYIMQYLFVAHIHACASVPVYTDAQIATARPHGTAHNF